MLHRTRSPVPLRAGLQRPTLCAVPESTTPPPPPSGPPATAQRTPLAPRDLVAEARSGLVPALVGLGSAFAAAILVTLVAVAGLALVGDAGATGTTDGVDTGSAAT